MVEAGQAITEKGLHLAQKLRGRTIAELLGAEKLLQAAAFRVGSPLKKSRLEAVIGIVRWRVGQDVCHFGSNVRGKDAGDVSEPGQLSGDVGQLEVKLYLQEPDLRVFWPVWWKTDCNMADRCRCSRW